MTIPITGQPEVPDLSDPATFNTKALNLFTWITGSMLDQFNNVDPGDWFGVQSGPMDATPGRVMLTGAGGLLQSGAGPLLANIDATTIPGSLARFDGTTAGTKPAGVATGTVLTVRGAGTNNLSQMVVSNDGMQLWFRACVAGVWGAWVRSISFSDRATGPEAIAGTDAFKYMTPEQDKAALTAAIASLAGYTDAQARNAQAGQGTGGVGSYAFMRLNPGGASPLTLGPGATVAGSVLNYSNSDKAVSSAGTGTWRCMGFAQYSRSGEGAGQNPYVFVFNSTLFLRIA
jgi:hypothetical protein